LWTRKALRDTLWKTNAPDASRRVVSTSGAGLSGAVERYQVSCGFCRAELKEQRTVAMLDNIGSLAPRRVDPVLDAWVDLIGERMDTERSCFFTGTYRDEYGYSHGLMLGRNALKDFKRFLKSEGLEFQPWVCVAEEHKTGRDILHVHALIGGITGDSELERLRVSWGATRGYAKSVPLLDGGVRYCSKYALKNQDASLFDWSWS